MRRRLALLVTATSLALLGGVAIAAPASAGPAARTPAATMASARARPQDSTWAGVTGQHLGWAKQGSTERRNVGGTCGPV